jgi:hypothetical protein
MLSLTCTWNNLSLMPPHLSEQLTEEVPLDNQSLLNRLLPQEEIPTPMIQMTRMISTPEPLNEIGTPMMNSMNLQLWNSDLNNTPIKSKSSLNPKCLGLPMTSLPKHSFAQSLSKHRRQLLTFPKTLLPLNSSSQAALPFQNSLTLNGTTSFEDNLSTSILFSPLSMLLPQSMNTLNTLEPMKLNLEVEAHTHPLKRFRLTETGSWLGWLPPMQSVMHFLIEPESSKTTGTTLLASLEPFLNPKPYMFHSPISSPTLLFSSLPHPPLSVSSDSIIKSTIQSNPDF